MDFKAVDTKDPLAVCRKAQEMHASMFGDDKEDFVAQAFDWYVESFEGRFGGYQPIDLPYHDLEHTLQGTLCYVFLMNGRYQAGVQPVLSRHLFKLGLLAILLHDSGYLKKVGDNEGTGAKYTPVHVDRSRHFAEELLTTKGFDLEDIGKIQHMISCTDPRTNFDVVPFGSDVERITGFAVTTADLLGQMAAADYVDRLQDLFSEFDESWRYSGSKGGAIYYESLEQLMRNTSDFWLGYVKPKLENDCLGLYRFLNEPYPDGSNEYLQSIESNISRIRDVVTTMDGNGDS